MRPMGARITFHFSKSEHAVCNARLSDTTSICIVSDAATLWVPSQCSKCTLKVGGSKAVFS
eukprot:8763424-Lingulodinium_polyedra.AAC.1